MPLQVIEKSMKPALAILKVLGLMPFGHASSSYFAIRLERPDWAQWFPGQFVMLKPKNFGLELPWGRPFSICHMTGRHLICFFRVVGRGTRLISELSQGDEVLVWGPLGNSFEIIKDTPTLLLAGGMGIAPFVGYVNRHPQPWNLTMLFGHRDQVDCYPVDSLNEHIPVDTLREHEPGDLDNFIYHIQEKMRDCAAQNGLALACGPVPFLRTVQITAVETGCKTQISVENRMACGVGACLGCVCKTAPAYKSGSGLPVQTCLHGPVFWSDQIEI